VIDGVAVARNAVAFGLAGDNDGAARAVRNLIDADDGGAALLAAVEAWLTVVRVTTEGRVMVVVDGGGDDQATEAGTALAQMLAFHAEGESVAEVLFSLCPCVGELVSHLALVSAVQVLRELRATQELN
jgi:hypothetical protein